MRTKLYRKPKTPNTPDKNNLFKAKTGLVFVFIGSYFIFSDLFGHNPFMDNFNFEQANTASGSFITPLLIQNGKIASSFLFYFIGIFFFGWEIFDIKVKK